jgi:putative spermidine/putrescine transport system permease protein
MIAALLAYPVALVMVRGGAVMTRAITMIVIAPLIVSVVVRTYGWQVILGSGPKGVLNWILLSTGLTRTPLRLLYTEAAVVIGSLHVFFPMMVCRSPRLWARSIPRSRTPRRRSALRHGARFAALHCR